MILASIEIWEKSGIKPKRAVNFTNEKYYNRQMGNRRRISISGDRPMDRRQCNSFSANIGAQSRKAAKPRSCATNVLSSARETGGAWMFVVSLCALRLCVMILFVVVGCSSADSPAKPTPSQHLAGVKLKLVVVDDPAIAAAVRGLKDEWNAQSSGEIEVAECKENDLTDAAILPGDALICPEHMLGPLAEAKRLAPVPHGISQNPNPHSPWSQNFPLLRDQEAAWANEEFGMPLGSPVFCCFLPRIC